MVYDLYCLDKLVGFYIKFNMYLIYMVNEEVKFNFYFDIIVIGVIGYYKV